MVLQVTAAAVSVIAAPHAAAQPDATATLIVRNAAVTTLDERRPAATAIAVAGERILAVGSDSAVAAYRTADTRVIDAGGRRLIPGLNDSHIHPTRGGRFYAAELRWDGIPKLATALARVREQAARTPAGQWVRVVGGWSPYQFEEARFPTTAELNAAAGDVPTLVTYLYSRAWLNAAGVRALGLSDTSAVPQGGRYEFTDDGGAVLYAEPHPAIIYTTVGRLPALTREQETSSTAHFYRELNRFGLTSVSDAAGGAHVFPDDYGATAALAREGRLPLRLSFYLFPGARGPEDDAYAAWITDSTAVRTPDSRLRHGYTFEGAGEYLTLSAGDYENFLAARPEVRERDGFREDLEAMATKLVREGQSLRIHATYGETLAGILDVFEAVDSTERAAGRAGFAGVRWAVDHIETATPEQIARVRALGGGVSVQARMAYAGEFFAERYGAEVAAEAPPLRALLDAGVPLGAGTDATRVASYNPWVALYWLVTGRTVGGTPLASPPNRLTREEALRLYTAGAAWFSGEEAVKGTLAPGQLADFALLTDDYFAVDEEAVRDIEATLTVVGGEVVYGAGPFAALAPQLPPINPTWSPVTAFGGYYDDASDE